MKAVNKKNFYNSKNLLNKILYVVDSFITTKLFTVISKLLYYFKNVNLFKYYI